MGEQIDRHCDMEARRMASMEPAARQANRGSGMGAIGVATAPGALTR